MIQLESFARFRKIDFLALAILTVLWAVATTLINLPNTQLTFMLSLAVTAIFVSFTALLIRKVGAVILFYFVGSAITISFNNLIQGYYKILILVIAGIIFELAFLLTKKIYKSNIPFNLVLAAALSNASIPWIILLFTEYSKELLTPTINFSLSALLIGIMGSLLTYLVWYNIKANKTIIKFEYSV